VSIRRKPDGMADLTAHLTAVEASTISAALDSAASAEVAREKAARKSAAADIAAAAGMAAAAGNSDTAGDPGTGAASHDAIPLLGERSNGERRADALIGALLGTGTDDEVGRAAGHAGPGAGVRAGAAARHGAAIAPLIRPVITVLAPRGPDDEPEVYFPRSGPAAIDAPIALLSRSVAANITLPDSTPGSSDTAGGRRRYRTSAEPARRGRLPDGTSRHPRCSEPHETCAVDHVRPLSHLHPPRRRPPTGSKPDVSVSAAPPTKDLPRLAIPPLPRRDVVRQHQQWPHPDHTARRPLGALARTRRRVRPTLGVDTPAGEHALVPTRAPG